MEKSELVAGNSTKIDFLIKVIDANNSRQELYDNRASILLAANAILLAGITGFGIPLTTSGSFSQWIGIKVSLVIASLLLSSVSTFLVGQLIAPIAFTKRSRQKILDLEDQEFNIYLFLKIAEYKKQEYLEIINNLTEEQIIKQLSSEAHNFSRLLLIRLSRLKYAYWTFIGSMMMFVALSIVSFLG